MEEEIDKLPARYKSKKSEEPKILHLIEILKEHEKRIEREHALLLKKREIEELERLNRTRRESLASGVNRTVDEKEDPKDHQMVSKTSDDELNLEETTKLIVLRHEILDMLHERDNLGFRGEECLIKCQALFKMLYKRREKNATVIDEDLKAKKEEVLKAIKELIKSDDPELGENEKERFEKLKANFNLLARINNQNIEVLEATQRLINWGNLTEDQMENLKTLKVKFESSANQNNKMIVDCLEIMGKLITSGGLTEDQMECLKTLKTKFEILFKINDIYTNDKNELLENIQVLTTLGGRGLMKKQMDSLTMMRSELEQSGNENDERIEKECLKATRRLIKSGLLTEDQMESLKTLKSKFKASINENDKRIKEACLKAIEELIRSDDLNPSEIEHLEKLKAKLESLLEINDLNIEELEKLLKEFQEFFEMLDKRIYLKGTHVRLYLERHENSVFKSIDEALFLHEIYGREIARQVIELIVRACYIEKAEKEFQEIAQKIIQDTRVQELALEIIEDNPEEITQDTSVQKLALEVAPKTDLENYQLLTRQKALKGSIELNENNIRKLLDNKKSNQGNAKVQKVIEIVTRFLGCIKYIIRDKTKLIQTFQIAIKLVEEGDIKEIEIEGDDEFLEKIQLIVKLETEIADIKRKEAELKERIDNLSNQTQEQKPSEEGQSTVKPNPALLAN